MKTNTSPTPQTSKTRSLKKFYLLSALICVSALAYFVYSFVNQPWYSEYSGPMISIAPHNDKESAVKKMPIATLFKLSGALDYMMKDKNLTVEATAVKAKVQTYLNLLMETYPKAEGLHVDFIAMLHPTIFNDSQSYMTAMKQSQEDVLTKLLEKKYGVVGKEGSWSDPLDLTSLREENIYAFGGLGIEDNATNRELLYASIDEQNKIDGSMRYKLAKPEARFIGVEDRELFYLHDKVAMLMNDEKQGMVEHQRYAHYDRLLVWFRTEIALAKVLKVMQKEGLQSAVFSMGQNHRSQFEVLVKDLGLGSTIIHTVPKDHRSDEAP